MKKLIAIAAAISMFAAPVFAGTYYEAGKVVTSEKVYSYAIEQVPVERCYNVGSRPSNGGDVLTGMIIGALIGKGATGNDKGAAAGAVIGGVIAGDKNHNRQVCETVYEERKVGRGGQYKITVMLDNGGYHTFYSDRSHQYNERVFVPVNK